MLSRADEAWLASLAKEAIESAVRLWKFKYGETKGWCQFM
jgi:hypothetical protein